MFRKLIYEKYKAEPFDIPRQDIENLLDEFVRTSGAESRAALEKSLLPAGITPERLREQARERIAVEVLLMRDCDHHVYITPREVYEEYKAHPEKWTVPEKISLQLLQINVTAGSAGGDPKAAVDAIRKELDKDPSQKNFTRLVLEKSDGATASTGGITEGAELDKLRPEFIAALKGKKTGDVIGPVEAPEAYFFLRVVGTEPAKLIPFSEANREVRDALFGKNPVFTKTRDSVPTIYRAGAKVTNSLVADGCVIDGEVENCVLFRGVRVGKGARLKNCVIMQDSYVEDDVELENVIFDKEVTIRSHGRLVGQAQYPIVIGKNITL